MIINDKNRAKIAEMIRKAEGRSTERTIAYQTIVWDIDRLERTLKIHKKDMIGIVACVDHNAQDFPKAYKYRPMSTHYEIVRKSSGWDLVSVKRDWTRRAGHVFNVTLTEAAEKAILDKMRDF